MKVSFLIPAHNEEKIISKTLENLEKIPLESYEVLIGLDGCTDGTEEIVKSFTKRLKNFSYFKFKSRGGKPEVIDYLVKESTGRILVINDADWIFSYGSKRSLNKFFGVFKDKQVGGIVDAFPVGWNKNTISKPNWVYNMVTYSSLYWMEFLKNNFKESFGGLDYVKDPSMFLTNVFRKEDYKRDLSLGDDFERTYRIFNIGKKLVIFDDVNMPRMVEITNNLRLGDLFRQKIRTAIARKQLKNKNNSFKPYTIGFYIIWRGFKESFVKGLMMFLWSSVSFVGELVSKFKKLDTKDGWNLRARR